MLEAEVGGSGHLLAAHPDPDDGEASVGLDWDERDGRLKPTHIFPELGCKTDIFLGT